MKRMLFCFAVIGLATAVFAQGKARPMDRDFAKKVAMGGAMEVQLGRYASQNGGSASVRAFGMRMVKDHTAAGRELMRIAKRQGVMLSPMPDGEMSATMRRLMKLTGRKFDHDYKPFAVADHQANIMMFVDESKNGHGPLQDFARNTLPTLRMHLQMAQAMKVGR